ncbi:hypothetical protein BJY04DRAFT_228652 [Aspergillus karnatakaensis]|uniref:FAD-dependent oxidoreductase n=1 Tax=Aspergillus karnatakaensis TaxID=1810916 RepID=UPI003CCCA614
MDNQQFRIIIVGGGIAGLATFRLFRSDGTLAKEITVNTQEKYGGVRMMPVVQDLLDALREAAVDPKRFGPPAKILTSQRVDKCDTTAGSVITTDKVALHADLIIGADGIKSTIRHFVLDRTQNAVKTGLSGNSCQEKLKHANVPQIPMQHMEQAAKFTQYINPRDEFTTMVLCHDHRLVMGPDRHGESYSVTFSDIPSWLVEPFRNITSMGLWQLRDLDPLETWTKGRAILVGDAAHAMLPAQGQGASQAIEDAEALGSFFEDIKGRPSQEQVTQRLANVFEARYQRATLVQKYSRQQARPATDANSIEIKLNTEEFAHFNYSYNGAKEWIARSSKLNGGQPGV